MLVRDIMRSPAVTISPETTLESAYRTMQERRIRHLPVLEGSRLVGVVTDRDLRLATSALVPAPFAPGSRVSEVMSQPPLTADPLDPVEDAARTMREGKIGCLPVLEDGRVVGILTGLDLLDGLIRMTGVGEPSGRLEVALSDAPAELGRLMGVLSARRLRVYSVLTHPESAQRVRTVLRVGTIETRPLAEELRRAGFQVVWPPEKPCPR
jgi:acetoin utilization protein AcuB